MKNIHLIPTDKEQHSIIQKHTGLLLKQTKQKHFSGNKFNLFITSDEEIKDGDWCLLNNRLVVRYFKPPVESKSFKKIILATDQDLIKDGVQAIDDEFLEWFVKNPSCEEVEIEKQLGCIELDAVCDFGEISCPNAPNCLKNKYKIIISKGEHKQECMITKNSYPSSEFESKDRCPSCGNFCNIHTDLNDNDECNDCRDNIDNL